MFIKPAYLTQWAQEGEGTGWLRDARQRLHVAGLLRVSWAKVWDGMQWRGFVKAAVVDLKLPMFTASSRTCIFFFVFCFFYWPKTSCMVLCVLYLYGYGPGGHVK